LASAHVGSRPKDLDIIVFLKEAEKAALADRIRMKIASM